MNFRRIWPCVVIALPLVFAPARVPGADDLAKIQALQTTAEKTAYEATSRYAEVMEFCKQLSALSNRVELLEMGATHEGRTIPVLAIADPPVKSVEEARRSKKLVVFAMGNIHAGEVGGKEALQMLARDLAAAEKSPLREKLIVLLAPIYNADGNERVAANHRPEQNGPREVGQRANAQGLDLNRDHVKLETAEAQALVKFLNEWSPAVSIDCHTTNGTYHRYAILYDSPRHPATNPAVAQFARDEFLPEVSRRMEQSAGLKSFNYGILSEDRKSWRTFEAEPRYSTHYFGLRNQIGILSEDYTYAPFRDRVHATHEFVRQCLTLAAERKEAIEKLRSDANDASRTWKGKDEPQLGMRWTAVARAGRATIAGVVERDENGKKVATNEPRDHDVEYFGDVLTTVAVQRPWAYLLPANSRAIENLQRHGIELEILREDVELDVEVYRITKVEQDSREFQKHKLVSLSVTRETAGRRFNAGTIVVKTTQPLARLIVTLLEPSSQDGLATWNYFDDSETTGGESATAAADQERRFPVARLMRDDPLLTAPYTAPRGDDSPRQPITFDTLYGSKRPDFSGNPADGVRWLEDGEHYVQSKRGRWFKVHALSGRQSMLFDPTSLAAPIRTALGVDERTSQQLAMSVQWNDDRTIGSITHRDDVYRISRENLQIVRMTDAAGAKELATLSPDGKQVAFVRGNDLFVSAMPPGKERQLTRDGSALLRNGKADWVYFEEIYNRSWHAFKWSPDSKRIVFQQFNDTGLDKVTIVNHLTTRLETESSHYPKAGRPNPKVRLGVVEADGGTVQWITLDDYSPDQMLISYFGWLPSSKEVYLFVQDRTQRWLDFLVADSENGQTRRLFRETTKAWVDIPSEPKFLKDGSFLFTSERDGWRHLYLYSAQGELIRQVTSGPWEVHAIQRIDEAAGNVFVTGTRDSHVRENLYRVPLDGKEPTRLTADAGSHNVSVNPKCTLFVDSVSNHARPTTVVLRSIDGSPVRTLDTNPVPAIREYELCPLELTQIKTRDGFVMEASVLKPPRMDPQRKYPVWILTYGGPHAPTLSDAWRGGRTSEQLLAHMGLIVLRVDPRSASGKGACSTWTAYRQLGIQELKDLEDAVDWMCQFPYVDSKRIGLSGHSYGGFLTAFALTHSKKFAAGIAGAPVTDWRNYDTIYTERYMLTPQENPEGYKNTSVVAAAKNLHGKLLLLHGARDDNVHLANSLQFAEALQRADKQFEMMMYPNSRHGLFGDHYQRLMVDFIRRTMLESASPPPSTLGP